MAARIGWRNFWWLNVGLCGLSVITCLVSFPETKWHRLHPAELSQSEASNDDTPAEKPATATPSKSDEEGIATVVTQEFQSVFPALGASETAQRDPYLGKGSPSKSQWKLWQPADIHNNIWTELTTPWMLFALPIVEFASFVVSWSASCFLTVSLTQSQNFAAPPYNYSSTTIGTRDTF